MGVFTNERKRNHHHSYTACKISALSSLCSDSYASKRSRLFTSSNQAHDSPMQEGRVSVVSRFHQYPDLKSQIKREPHAPVRPSKFGGFQSSKSTGLKFVSNDRANVTNEKGDSLRKRYDRAKQVALESLRHYDVVVIKNDEVFETKDDEVVEVVNVEQGPSGDSSIDGEFKAFSSPAMRNVSNDNMKVDSAEKMFESLSLSEKKDAVGLVDYKNLLRDVDRCYKKLDSLNFQIEITEKKRVGMQQFRPRRKVDVEAEDTMETFGKEMMAQAFKPLTMDELDQVTSALSSHQRRKLLVTHESSNIDITVDLLQCLRPKMWLNDEVINLYLELLKEREKREPEKFLKCHFFNTFFFKKLISGKDGYNFQSVRRWTSQKKLGYFIFDCDKIFVPIHKQIHWCLAVINKKEEKFQYLDSLGHADSHVLKVLARYFADEVKDKNGKEIDVSSWKQEFVEDLPVQKNGFDCGVFMIKYADFYSRDIGLCFDQEHMPYFRQRTGKEILNLKAD